MPELGSSTQRETDYLRALRPFFHPVARLAELDELGVDEHGMRRVLGKELLGERIVVARLGDRVVAMHGTCPHRGAGLEIGWVNCDATAVACRYHGFEWAADGRILRVPAIEAEGRAVPTGRNWRVQTYPTVVKYGLIWVCLEPQPRFPILHVPEADDPAYVALPIRETAWRAGCGRIVESSLDTYHFAFAHWGTIGDPSKPEAPKTTVEVRDDCFYIEYSIQQPRNKTVTYAPETTEAGADFLTARYQFWAIPNSVHLLKSAEHVGFGVFVGLCPVRPHLTAFYRILYVSRDWDLDHDEFQRTQNLLNKQDQDVVESQRPWELSTDLDAELQAYVDRPTVDYRRWLARLGIQFL